VKVQNTDKQEMAEQKDKDCGDLASQNTVEATLWSLSTRVTLP